MDTLNVNGYGANSNTTGTIQSKNYLATTPTSVTGSSNLTKASSKSSLDMNDFLALLVAQMKNQDIMNPMDNTQFVAQMAQFSSLQAMTDMSKTMTSMQSTVKDLSTMTSVEYGASLMGKKVHISFYDEEGKIVNKKGVVSSVCPSSDGSLITLADDPKTYYHLSNVMEIVTDFPATDAVASGDKNVADTASKPADNSAGDTGSNTNPSPLTP